MAPSRPRKAPMPTHCESCNRRLPERHGPGRPRRKCTHCAPPPSKTTFEGRARRPAPVIVEPPVSIADTDADTFGVRGQVLWDEWFDLMPNPGALALLREACRLADRAERMHRLLEGHQDVWAVLKIDDVLEEVLGAAAHYGETPEIVVNVNVSSIAIEARNTATAMRSIVAELRAAVRQAGAEQDGENDDAIAKIAQSMSTRAPSAGNVVQMRQR